MAHGTAMQLLPATVLGRAREILENLDWIQATEQLRALAVLAIGAWAVYLASQLVWPLLPSPAAPAAITLAPSVSPSLSAAALRGAPPPIAALTSQPLFGKYEEPESAPPGPTETPLNLRLSGIMHSSNPNLLRVAIRHRNKQELYALGDELPVAGAKVQAIAQDHVLIERSSGKVERLSLYDKKNRARPENTKVIDRRGNRQATTAAKRYYKNLMKNPADLGKVLRFSAIRKGQDLIGYRISPRNDARSFIQLGFRSGDIVKAINNVDLASLVALQQAHASMHNASQASFLIQRGKEHVELLVKLR